MSYFYIEGDKLCGVRTASYNYGNGGSLNYFFKTSYFPDLKVSSSSLLNQLLCFYCTPAESSDKIFLKKHENDEWG